MFCPRYQAGAQLSRESTMLGWVARKRASWASSLAGKELFPNLYTPCSHVAKGSSSGVPNKPPVSQLLGVSAAAGRGLHCLLTLCPHFASLSHQCLWKQDCHPSLHGTRHPSVVPSADSHVMVGC